MAPNVQRPDPPYMQIVAHIRGQVLAGELREGDMVPSARQITQDWHVALATATKVLAALRSEGYARTVPGVGTVVSGDWKHAAHDRVVAIHRTGRIYPPNERARILSADLVPAPAHVAGALGIEPGATVVGRTRVTYRDEIPVSTSTSWFAGALAERAPLLLVTERILQGTAGYIEEITGRTATSGRDQLAARAAGAQESEALQVPVGSPVLCRLNWFYDADGAVIEYGEGVSVPGRWSSYDYRIERSA